MAIGYYFFRMLAYLFSLLPFRVAYWCSDGLSFTLCHVIGYRREVILSNLRLAFPEKPEREIKAISRKYYRNICDVLVETIKVDHMKQADFATRISFSNLNVLEALKKNGQSVLLVTGHLGNWEWTGIAALPLLTPYKNTFVFAKPLSSKTFHRYIFTLRNKFGSVLIAQDNPIRMLAQHQDTPYVLMIAGDQTPPRADIQYWSTFLNQETAHYLSAEKLARHFNLPVVFMNVRRLGRGDYVVDLEPISENPGIEEPYAITERYVRKLEAAIRVRPDNWLWSHRRWKHKK